MNIVSAMVGMSIMGAALPMVAQMSIQPSIAQKKAENFGVAEIIMNVNCWLTVGFIFLVKNVTSKSKCQKFSELEWFHLEPKCHATYSRLVMSSNNIFRFWKLSQEKRVVPYKI